MSTLDMSSQPLSSLAKSMLDAEAPAATHAHHDHHCHGSWWSILFTWLVAAIVVYFVLFALKPDFVLKDDDYHHSSCDEIDQGKLLGSAVLISIVIIVLIWVLVWGFGYSQGEYAW